MPLNLTKTRIALLSGIILFGFAASEVGLRMAGAIDVPIFDTDAEIGYIPKSNQHGAFLNKNHWIVNERHLDVAQPWTPNGDKDLLLVGDSIVWGGNALDQPEKLGPLLQNQLPGWKIWPLSAGSWSVENPWAWFKRNPDVLPETDILVWVINTGDFAPITQWKSELTHPRTKPASALFFVGKKYILPRLKITPAVAEPTGQNNPIDPAIAVDWAKKLTAFKGRLLIVIYPELAEVLKKSPNIEKLEAFRSAFVKAFAPSTDYIDLAKIDGWNETYYRDDIHPSAEGDRFIAKLIASHLSKTSNLSLQPQDN